MAAGKAPACGHCATHEDGRILTAQALGLSSSRNGDPGTERHWQQLLPSEREQDGTSSAAGGAVAPRPAGTGLARGGWCQTRGQGLTGRRDPAVPARGCPGQGARRAPPPPKGPSPQTRGARVHEQPRWRSGRAAGGDSSPFRGGGLLREAAEQGPGLDSSGIEARRRVRPAASPGSAAPRRVGSDSSASGRRRRCDAG